MLETPESEKQPCRKAGKCVTRGVWGKVAESINGVLDSITLHDLCHSSAQKA